MTKEEIIRNLKYTMEKHKNDIVNTFDTNISVMCKDILDYFEEQEPCDNCIFEEGSKYCIEHCPHEAQANKPCEDVISRERALEPYKGLNDDDVISVRLIKKNIIELPPVTPNKPKGHWVHKGQGIYCSECGEESGYNPFGASRFSDYCPSCGIEMESEE